MRSVLSSAVAALLCYSGFSGGSPFPGNPVVSDDAVFVIDGGVARYDKGGGRADWHFPVAGRVFAPALGKGVVLVAGATGVYALDERSGVPQWHLDLKGAFSPRAEGEAVFIAQESGHLSSVESASGRVRWRRKLGDGWIYPPAVDGDSVVTGGRDGVVWGLDKHSGEILWQRPAGQELVYSPVTLEPGVVVASTFAGELISMDSANGRVIWRTDLGLPGTDIRRIGGLLFAVGMDGSLRAIDRGTGREIWARRWGSRPTLASGPGPVVVLPGDGRFQLLDPLSGKTLRSGAVPLKAAGSALLSPGEMLVIAADRNDSRTRPVIVDMRCCGLSDDPPFNRNRPSAEIRLLDQVSEER